MFNYFWTNVGQGPLWFSSGHHPCPLLQLSDFESCWILKFSVQKENINFKEAGVGPSLKKDVGYYPTK